MLVSSLISRINYNLRGIDDAQPSIGDDEGIYWISVANAKITELYEDITKQWRFSFKPTTPYEVGTVATVSTTTLTGTSTFFTDYNIGDTITIDGETVRTIATITSDTVLTVTVAFSHTASSKSFYRDIIIQTGLQTYNLHRRFLGASDDVYVTTADPAKTYYSVIQPQERTRYTRNVYISDENPQAITFTTTIESTENIIGKVLTVPGYYGVAEISDATDVVPVPDPEWLAIATAADLAFSDIIYEDKAEGLNIRANNRYGMMVLKNRRGTSRNPRRLQTTNSYRIHGPTRRDIRTA